MLYMGGAQCARGGVARRRVQRTVCRCPAGSVRAAGTCVNVNECEGSPCRNGGTCVDREPARRYDCVCAFGYAGHDCELELLASGIITPSRDFIIAIIVCLFMLLGEHHISMFTCMLLQSLNVSLINISHNITSKFHNIFYHVRFNNSM